jgi:hypothetical protein
VWGCAIVVYTLFVGTQVHAGSKSFTVRAAPVIDNTLDRDDTLALSKCRACHPGLHQRATGPTRSVRF